jgi:hypothetical protein
MLGIIDFVGFALKAADGARTAGRLLGRETPELDELHSALAPVRRHKMQDSVVGTATSQQSADGDPGDGDGPLGLVADATHWIMDKLDHIM